MATCKHCGRWISTGSTCNSCGRRANKDWRMDSKAKYKANKGKWKW